MNRARFFTIGNVSIDDLVFSDGTTMWCVPGGNAIYSALGMAVWGEQPDVIAPIGPEYPVGKLRDRINIQRCRLIERNLRNWGLYEEDGTRHFIFRSQTRNWLDFSPTIDDLDKGPFACCHLAPLPWRLQLAFAAALREKGAGLLSVDLDDRRLSDVPIAEVAELLALVDLFMPSRQDVAEIFPGRTPLDALKALRALSPDTPVIAIKCGAAGAISHQRNESEYLSSPSMAERAVDETGAGDAFCGGAVLGFSRRRVLSEALACGAVSASFAVEGVGPAALVAAEPEVVERRLRRATDRIEAYRF
jgi:sugar/nucleoside kinase (ribokinase family)